MTDRGLTMVSRNLPKAFLRLLSETRLWIHNNYLTPYLRRPTIWSRNDMGESSQQLLHLLILLLLCISLCSRPSNLRIHHSFPRPSGGRNLRSSRDELRQETVPEEFERMSLHDSQYPPRPPSGGMQGYLPREGAAAPPLPRPPTRERDSQPSTSQHLQQQTYHHHHHQQQQQVHQQQTQTQHKPRSHRRTGSLETTQFQGLHGYLYQPTK